MNIFDMLREDLKQEINYLIRKASTSRKSVHEKGIKIKINGSLRMVNVGVKKILPPLDVVGSFLVTFEEVLLPKISKADNKLGPDKKAERVIKELERELKSVKANLRIVIEDIEASNEELKSSNEEMQSTNEEMQSTNEELETSKEELQSLNEELITVNTEFQNKNEELTTINDDMKNLLDSIKIPTIFLDNNLNIKRFTSHATKVINLIPSDLGRPINHIATNLKYENLLSDADEVLSTLVFKEIELQTKEGIWYQMRIFPYRTTNNIIDGVVLTFTEINNLKAASDEINILNNKLGVALEYVDNILDTVRDSLLILDEELKVVSANRSFYKLFNTSNGEVEGKYIYELDKNWNKKKLRDLLEDIIPKRNFFEDFELDYNLASKENKKLLLNARQILKGEEGTKLILLAIQEV
ncbi:MAG: PAS domain-containing protein [Melioribacteraceae bacterium]|nr:PAS domain-containing protein [Melioribacteraceae bacterium]